MTKPNWMNKENKKAEDTKELPNSDAPQLKRVEKEPSRRQKSFYLQDKISEAFEDFAILEKRKSKRKAPGLIEEAIIDLLKKHGVDVKKLL